MASKNRSHNKAKVGEIEESCNLALLLDRDAYCFATFILFDSTPCGGLPLHFIINYVKAAHTF